ncbi:MbtH family NRPS accessory protein [Dactylosporangium sp. NBC_01737]|uniref:MbtH family protein n=1 Tax=Dactylosporangium sp. NBC_01737 TaxID=2975959 RepID=UPI002E0D7556|nr:MbtH family NRPS accessory protein [Dactylosporangium sp. NBC_01737]
MTVSTDERTYLVVRNHEDQYSIWPAGQDVPDGWAAEGAGAFEGPKDACLAHIAEVWTDLRPLSLRHAGVVEGGVHVG